MYFFRGLHFASQEEPVNSLISEKLQARIKVNRKNKSAHSAGPTFSQQFPTQVSPNYILLDPIYYEFENEKSALEAT